MTARLTSLETLKNCAWTCYFSSLDLLTLSKVILRDFADFICNTTFYMVTCDIDKLTRINKQSFRTTFVTEQRLQANDAQNKDFKQTDAFGRITDYHTLRNERYVPTS